MFKFEQPSIRLTKVPINNIHPQYITDSARQKLVVLPMSEFKELLDELEELEDIKLYDEAKKEDDGSRTDFNDYIKQRTAKNG